MSLKDFEITRIHGREVLDSRGRPTIEVEVGIAKGILEYSLVPSGVSTGSSEALEIRDNVSSRFHGLGVETAVNNVNNEIAFNLLGHDIREQRVIDNKLIKLDGTENKSRLGANAILGVSLASAKSASKALNLSLYQYLGGIRGFKLPVPMMNVINGGRHAGNNLAIQEFLIIPVGSDTYKESLRMGVEVYHELGILLKRKYGHSSINLGDEGGYAPPINKTRDAIEVILNAIENSGYQVNKEVRLGIDAAASSFYDTKKGMYTIDDNIYDNIGLLDFYLELIKNYHIRSIEDPFTEDDYESHSLLLKKVNSNIQIVGDDLFVTNTRRIQKGINLKSANALLLKVNQIGTLSESIDAAEQAFENGWSVIVSHRSGETEDSFIADLSVGLGAQMIKAGAPSRGERTAKYNRLLRIEEELSRFENFWGKKIR